ncbi:MAG: methyltransferase, partial [Candidatus Micrarchaeota archaeon]|nr:methyltransferase [Candidatus Micrarchaeota archaeon]
IGTGSGILGLVGGTNRRVKKITFVDINPKAVRLAQKNYIRNREMIGAGCKFVKTDLFLRIKGKFDLVVFNAPYLPSDENSNSKILNRAWNGGEDGMEICIKFLQGLRAHLSREGRALMVISSFGNLGRMRSEAVKLGLRIRTVARKHIFFEDIIVVEVKASKGI